MNKYYIIIETPSRRGWRIFSTDKDLNTADGIIAATDEFIEIEKENCMIVSWVLLNE